MLNLSIPVNNQVTFGSKSLRVFGPKVSNNLPYHIKSSENLESFKMIINTGTVQDAIVKFVIHHKIMKDRDCLSKVNLGLLKRPRCTILGWLLIISRCCDVDVVIVANPLSGFCSHIFYNFNPMFLV